jgi:hypothetical protein
MDTSTMQLLTRKEAALYLRVCKTTLDRLEIARVCIRRRVFFPKIELEKYLSDHTQVKGVQS